MDIEMLKQTSFLDAGDTYGERKKRAQELLHMCHMEAVVGNHWAEFLHTILHSWEAGLLQIPNPNATEIQQKAEQRVSH